MSFSIFSTRKNKKTDEGKKGLGCSLLLGLGLGRGSTGDRQVPPVLIRISLPYIRVSLYRKPCCDFSQETILYP